VRVAAGVPPSGVVTVPVSRVGIALICLLTSWLRAAGERGFGRLASPESFTTSIFQYGSDR
jgi:hypothetical protein